MRANVDKMNTFLSPWNKAKGGPGPFQTHSPAAKAKRDFH